MTTTISAPADRAEAEAQAATTAAEQAHSHLTDLYERADNGDETVTFAAVRAAERQARETSTAAEQTRQAATTARRQATIDTADQTADELTAGPIAAALIDAWKQTLDTATAATEAAADARKYTPHGTDHNAHIETQRLQVKYDRSAGCVEPDEARKLHKTAAETIATARTAADTYRSKATEYNARITATAAELRAVGIAPGPNGFITSSGHQVRPATIDGQALNRAEYATALAVGQLHEAAKQLRPTPRIEPDHPRRPRPNQRDRSPSPFATA